MAVGTSGVAGSSSPQSGAFGAADRVLDLVRNAEEYQKRIADLEAATKAAEDAKREARRIIANAKRKAEADAKAITDAAEEQAQDRLNAVQDLETKLADQRRAWELEKSEEEKHLRSERGKAGAAKRAAEKAKEEAEAEKAKAASAADAHKAAELAFREKAEATKAIWNG